ncbi:protein kinase domain-containing protein [Pseudonocardia sp. CA-107938]|uniref:protein kinase domain-containing protein n=1 Tax=Pseudonocardia sp. CA-107938 TaxID=3240021 RepID=UPI003D8E9F01
MSEHRPGVNGGRLPVRAPRTRIDDAMADADPSRTQRPPAPDDDVPDIRTELAAAGFVDPEEIGRGGFGAVFRCGQPELDRTVAVKVLTSHVDPDNLERFLREQRAMGRLSGHPHIVAMMQVGATASGRPFIVMQYHPKGSLDGRLRQHGVLDWPAVLRLGVKICGALEAAHRAGTLHRDVKPGNILLTDYGEPQLTDFGIARVSGGFQTSVGAVAGSPGFTAPELLRGADPTPAADVYGLGATLFCSLTGHAVFERHSGEEVFAHFVRLTTQPVADLREIDVPDDVCHLIERAMAGEPAGRPATAAEFGEELRELQRRHQLGVDDMALPADLAAAPAPDPSGPATGAYVPSAVTPTPTTPPAPAAKYRPPTPAAALVPRERLITALRAGRTRQLTLVHAPSGFGKTTLAAQWCDVLAAEGVEVAWLTVDEDDDNPVWFLSHLIEAIRRVRAALADDLAQVLAAHLDEAARYVLTALVERVDAGPGDVLLVIDDWHRVSAAESVAALAFLVENAGPRLRVLVTSRSRSGLPLGRLRVRDELVVVDAAALRFDAAESRSLLVDVGRLQLAGAQVAALAATTDGWVAALQLAALSLRGGTDPALLIEHLSAHDDIGEFLAANVLDALDPALLEFLMRTSVTERTCGSLASALAGVRRGQAGLTLPGPPPSGLPSPRLEEVEARGLFLQRVGPASTWYRYHHLFRDHLRVRLERDLADEVDALHRTASDWFAEHDMLNEAVDHALAAGDRERAIELVELDETDLLERGEMTTLLGIIAKLPQRLVETRSRIQLVAAWANALLQRPAPTRTALTRFHAALDRSDLTGPERADLRAEADVLRSVGEVFADRLDGIDALTADALHRPESLPVRVAGAAANVATMAATLRFDFAAAVRWQEFAAPYHARMGPYVSIYGRCFAGIAARERLDVAAAADAFGTAVEIASTALGPGSHAARLAGVLLGELRYETGDLDEAARLLDAGDQLGTAGGGVDFMIARYAIGARVAAALGDRPTAARRLSAGLQVARELALPRLAARIVNERIRLGIDTALVDADGVLAPRTVPRDSGIATTVAEIDEDSAVRLLLDGDRETACRRAAALVEGIDGGRRPLAALRANLLLAGCLAALHRDEEARAALAPAAARCAELGLHRLVADEAPHAVRLLDH